MKQREISIHLSFTEIIITVENIGTDLCIAVQGGKPHIGCTVLAVPRKSLKGDSISCTSSVINVTGHKDEEICRYLAEKAAAKYNVTAVCTGGIHIDGITSGQLEELREGIEKAEI